MSIFFLDGKQIGDGTVSETQLSSSVSGGGLTGGAGSVLAVGAGTGMAVNANDVAIDEATGSVTFTGGTWTMPVDVLQVTGTPDSANDSVNKAYVDSVAGGVTWIAPIVVDGLVGNLGEVAIEALTPTAGDSYVVSAVDGDSTIDGTAAAIGDIFEYDGTNFVKVVSNSGGFVPAGTRAIASTQTALISPYTDATDDGKIAEYDGTSNLIGAITLTSRSEGDAVLVVGVSGETQPYNDNKAYSFSGTVPTGTWIQFAGPGQITAGAGLLFSGTVLNIVSADNSLTINADDMQVKIASGGGIEVIAGGLTLNAYAGADTSIATVVFDSDGVGVDTDDDTLTHVAGVLQVKTDGVGANEVDLSDTYNFQGSSGVVRVTTQSADDNTTLAASTAFVQQEIGSNKTNIFDCIRRIVVRTADTANIDIGNLPVSIGGLALSSGDLFLLTGQSTGSQNGVWEYTSATGAAVRNVCFNTGTQSAGTEIRVIGGTNDDTTWVVTSAIGADIVDTDSLAISEDTGPLTAGNGINFNSNAIEVNPDSTGGANIAQAINVVANGVGVLVDDTTITGNASNQLRGTSPELQDRNVNPTGNSVGVDNFDSGVGLNQTPALGRTPDVYLNGMLQVVARNDGERAASPWYFGTSGVAVADGSLASGDALRYNAAVVGVDIATTDRIDIVYSRNKA